MGPNIAREPASKMARTTTLDLVCFGLCATFAAGCEEATPPARSPQNAQQPEFWAAPPSPPP